MNFFTGQRVRVRYDDSNPILNGKEVVVLRQITNESPYWIEVSLGKDTYMVRGSEVLILDHQPEKKEAETSPGDKKIMSKTKITAELDNIANELQTMATGNPKIANVLMRSASKLDLVSNTLEKQKRTAAQESPADDYPEGEFGPENEHQDAYEAKPGSYHKVPVGKDSLSKAIGKNISEILSDLDFAQASGGKEKHEINIQARKNSKKASPKAWPFNDLSPSQLSDLAARGRWDLVGRAASLAKKIASEMEVDEDETGSSDDLSTADLAETGDESDNPPLDASQEGGKLQFFGTYPQGEGGGPDSGHHRSGSKNRALLRKASDPDAPVVVDQPNNLHNSEEGENVERDNPLGGLSGQNRSSSKSASSRYATVYRPQHVPKELHSVWHGAAQYLANRGQLLTASGQINYTAINQQYVRAMNHLGRVAAKVTEGENRRPFN
jgi:hypothetical protein